MKTFVEIFSKDDFKSVNEIQTVLSIVRENSESGNYQPYQIRANNSYKVIRFKGSVQNSKIFINAYLTTLKLAYVIQVWELAHNLTKRRYYDYDLYEWAKDENKLKQVKFTSPNRLRAEDFFFTQLQEICNGGKIIVSENAMFRRNKYIGMKQDELELDISISEDSITDSMMDKIIRQYSSNEKYYLFEKKNIKFSFEEIKDFFVKADEHLLSLLNSKDGLNSISEIEKEMLDHAENMNLQGILQALEKGADINAIDTDGETALTKVIKAWKYDSVRNDYDDEDFVREPDYPNEEKIAVAEKLISLGADVNLFGHDGVNGLMYSSYQHNPVLMKFLLANGANPNINYFTDDDLDFISSDALDNVCGDYNFFTDDKEKIAANEKVLDEMYAMLKNAGAKN